MKMTIVSTKPYSEKMKLKVNSDNYFNHPEENKVRESFSDVEPIDYFGSFVPQDKSETNLKKTEENIRARFQLDLKEE